MKLKKIKNKQKFTFTIKQMEQMKAKAMNDAIEVLTLFPLLTLRDEYGFGEKRLKKFLEHMQSNIDAYNEGRIKLEDVARVLDEEVNIKIGE